MSEPSTYEAALRRIAELEAEVARLRKVIRWALGEIGNFPTRRKAEGAYWWRRELRKRAALGSKKEK